MPCGPAGHARAGFRAFVECVVCGVGARPAGYVASKWGAYGLTLALAEEFRGRGIRVTALLPGSTDTPFWDSLGGAPFPKSDMLTPDQVADAAFWALESPSSVSVDEIRILPPKGIL